MISFRWVDTALLFLRMSVGGGESPGQGSERPLKAAGTIARVWPEGYTGCTQTRPWTP